MSFTVHKLNPELFIESTDVKQELTVSTFSFHPLRTSQCKQRPHFPALNGTKSGSRGTDCFDYLYHVLLSLSSFGVSAIQALACQMSVTLIFWLFHYCIFFFSFFEVCLKTCIFQIDFSVTLLLGLCSHLSSLTR